MQSLTNKTKLEMYDAYVVSVLLYGCEAWPAKAEHLRMLENFQWISLMRMLGVSTWDHIPYTELLAKAQCLSIETRVGAIMLRWLGHVERMGDERIPKRAMHASLPRADSAGRRGRPFKSIAECQKRYRRAFGIDEKTWPIIAQDREAWRTAVKRGRDLCEQQVIAKRVEKREKRKAKAEAATEAVEAPNPDPAL